MSLMLVCPLIELELTVEPVAHDISCSLDRDRHDLARPTLYVAFVTGLSQPPNATTDVNARHGRHRAKRWENYK